MNMIAALLTAAAVAVAVLAFSGLPVSLPGIGSLGKKDASSKPRLFRHFEAEGVPVARGLGVSAAAATATFAVLWAATASVLIAGLPAVVVAGLPSSYYSSRGRKRDKEQRASWPDALRGLVGSLQAGRSLHEALVDQETTGPAPLRPVFARYSDLTKLAVPEAEALAVIRDELADAVTDRVFEVLIIASTKGSRIALRVLNDLADSVTGDIQLTEKMQTASTEQGIQAWAVFVLPWLTLVMMTARPGDYRDYYATGAGTTILLVGSAMSIGGMVMIRMLNRTKAEPRVLLSMTKERTP